MLQNSGVDFLVTVSEWFPTAAAMRLVADVDAGRYGPDVALVALAAWAGAGLILAHSSRQEGCLTGDLLAFARA